MRRITLWFLSTVAAVVLLFSYRTSTTAAPPGTVSAGGTALSGTSAGGASTSTTTTGGSGGDGTYDGTVVQTRWGPVQVRIVVSGGRITSVIAVQFPDSNFRDQQINANALPILEQEVLAAQSAQIDTVSGATVTSNGYRTSLQAAIDLAHLG